MAYENDVAFIAATPTSMSELFTAAEESARSLGLSFNPRKDATLHHGRRREPITMAFQGDSYLHLGVSMGVCIDQTPYSATQELINDFNAVSVSLLTPCQKTQTVATFLLLRHDFLLRGGITKLQQKI